LKRRDIYLDNLPVDEAKRRFMARLEELGALRPLNGEKIPVSSSLGRVTAGAVYAKISSPHYNSAAMDGIAVRARDTFGASETNPVRLTKEQCRYVDTGDPLPDGFDAVVMVEDIQPLENGEVELISAVYPWQHVRPIGEDIVAAEMILPENHRIRPQDIGAMLAGGVLEVEVRRRPVVSIIPTGTELVKPGSPLNPGDIIEYNSEVLKGFVLEWGGTANISDIKADDYSLIRDEILKALSTSDIVIVNAGSSAGSEDYTSSIVEEIGELLVHGIASKPGKPVILGIAGGKPVIGIPGYPVSAVLAFDLFVKPLVFRLQGTLPPERARIKATAARKIPSKIGVEEYLRVKLGDVGGRMIATPLARGAGVITSLVRADGILKIPAPLEGFHAGEEIEVELLREKRDIENTVVVIGSHDLALDILGDHIRRRYPHISLSSAHVGSMGGIMALQKGETHGAGIHLLDPETGEYNIPYLEKYLPGKDIVLVNLAYRDQGIMVKRGNPKNIKNVGDLAGEGITFVNRQKGAGTRLLLDYELKKLGISPERIVGYEREEYTHMAVAAAVAGGSADAGLGILAAANSLGLDFIPVARERYDLAIPAEFMGLERVKAVLETINTPQFKKDLEALGGYHTEKTGEILKGDRV
jgi:putative molybdopterin biosynthesis protein